MKVNRRTVYNWFQQKYLKPDIILKIGLELRHDFCKDFPEMFSNKDFQKSPEFKRSDQINNDGGFKEKYISLLEKYNQMLLDLAILNETKQSDQ